MKTLYVENFFNIRVHGLIKEFVASRQYQSPIDVDMKNFYREWVYRPPFFDHIHNQLIEVASHIFGEPVKPSYSGLSMYGKNGICPLHTDRPQCKYSIDYCIDTDCEWPIYIVDQPFISIPNSMIAYSGTDDRHYRERIPGTFCNLAFFHFVPVSYEGDLD